MVREPKRLDSTLRMVSSGSAGCRSSFISRNDSSIQPLASQSAVSWSVRFAARPGGSDLIAAEISFVSAEQAGGTTSDTWYSGQ
jgi:hypothetical protein